MSLAQHLSETIASLRLRPGRAIVAVSGGADSVALWHLLHDSRAQHNLDLIVAHIDHGIQDVSAPRAIVERHAARLGARVVTIALQLGADCSETEARRARLTALEELAESESAEQIFLAHHADDQAETVLMRLLRGSGPVGLAGMAKRRGRFVRPLLGISRAELEAYLAERALEFWSDPANADSRHLRSWLRSAILPAIRDRLPDVDKRLGDAAGQARTNGRAWQEALRSWPGLDWRRDPVDSIDWGVVSVLPAALRLTLLRAFAREAGARPAAARLRDVVQALTGAGSGTAVDLGGGWRAELAFGRLRLLPPQPERPLPPMPLAPAIGELEWGAWRLAWSVDAAPLRQDRSAAVAWFAPGALTVRQWQPGDRLMPMGGVGHRLAVRCFQDARVPSSARAGWPVIDGGEGIAWIPGVCRSDQLLPVPGATSIRVEVFALG